MNNKALTILNPRSFVGIFSDYGCSKTEKSVSFTDTDVQTFLEWEENQSTKRKTESYVFSGFGNGISRGWEQQSTAGAKLVELPLADFGTVREIFLLSVRTKSITKNFFLSEKYVYCFFFCYNSTHFFIVNLDVRPHDGTTVQGATFNMCC